MRNLIYAINITLDGCCDHAMQAGTEEIMEHYTQLLREVDLLVYGRTTYQLMVPYWSNVAKDASEAQAEIDFAKTFVSKNKVVFSRSLDNAQGREQVKKDDANARIVSTELREEILKLKKEPGKSILAGGVDIPSQLVELGLVDEFRIMVMPVIVGKGRRLFDGVNLPEKLKLKLVETKSLKSGCVALRYVKQ